MNYYISKLEEARTEVRKAGLSKGVDDVLRVAIQKDLHRLSLLSDAEALVEGEEAVHAVLELPVMDDMFDEEEGEGL